LTNLIHQLSPVGEGVLQQDPEKENLNTLEHAAIPCNTLQHNATHCNTLQRTATHCNAQQRTATHCNKHHIEQPKSTHCNTLQHTATHCNTLQHTATHCNTLQHTATHCNTPTLTCWRSSSTAGSRRKKNSSIGKSTCACTCCWAFDEFFSAVAAVAAVDSIHPWRSAMRITGRSSMATNCFSCVWCSIECVVVCCSGLQCVVVPCRLLVALALLPIALLCILCGAVLNVLQYVAVCRSMLRCVAECCSAMRATGRSSFDTSCFPCCVHQY